MTFRVNQHGPGDGFHLAFVEDETGDKFDTDGTVLLTGFDYTIPDSGERDVSVKYTVPNRPCSKCAMQIKGMGRLNEDTGEVKGRWYNCADIEIVAPPKCPDLCETGNPQRGNCVGVTCECNEGFAGPECSIAVSPDGTVNLEIKVAVASGEFNKDSFRDGLAAAVELPAERIEVFSHKAAPEDGHTMVVFRILDAPEGSAGPKPLEVQGQIETAVENDQLNIPDYPVAALEAEPVPLDSNGNPVDRSTVGDSDDSDSNGGGGGSGGKVAAGILVPLALIGIAVGGFMFHKKRQESSASSRAPALPTRSDPPPVPPRV